MPRPPRVVLDTNVVISAFLTPGKSRTIVELSAQRKLLVFSSPALEEELRITLVKNLSYSAFEVEQALLTYREVIYKFVYPRKHLRAVKSDPPDNRILEAAQEANADEIVSGDRHLLSLGRFKKIRIVDPTDFLSSFADHRL